MSQKVETAISARAPSRVWVRDTSGRPSASLTLVVVAFVVVTLAYACGMIGQIGSVTFRPFDPTVVGAYLVPILTLYFGRRMVGSKSDAPVTHIQDGNGS